MTTPNSDIFEDLHAKSAESPLNEGQQNAAEGFFEFLMSNEKEMGITGPGGVGKTHLMGYMIDKVMPRYYEFCDLMKIPPEFQDVHMTATTNKAVEQLSRSTGQNCSTIQSFLNLKVQNDYSSGQSKLTKKNTWKVHKNSIIFVDECSMIDTPLDNYLQEGTHDCKIVYVGDHCQLAPVTETLSPVYKRPMRFYHLTQQMRTNVPELQALNMQLRETVETGQFKPIKIVPGIIDHLDDEAIAKELEIHFKSQTERERVLAYTNDRVKQFNHHIRGIRQLSSRITPGEILVNNTAVHIGEGMLNTDKVVVVKDVASTPTNIFINSEISIEVLLCDLESDTGQLYRSVRVPTDPEYVAEVIKYLGKHKKWVEYFNLRDNFPDLRPQDASTVHKAQGSTFDTVFVDLDNISTCRNPNQAARMLNVAFTRARHRVICYGNLADKFGGLSY